MARTGQQFIRFVLGTVALTLLGIIGIFSVAVMAGSDPARRPLELVSGSCFLGAAAIAGRGLFIMTSRHRD
jgi:hypothetical protein